MESLYRSATEALCGWIQQHTGVLPTLRVSRDAHVACSSFFGDAAFVANKLERVQNECTLLGAPLVERVSAQNGWLLLWLTAQSLDAYAAALPASFVHGDAYVDRRLAILLRHGDAPCPKDERVEAVVWRTVFAARDGAWTSDTEKAVLTVSHALDGQARIDLEHAMGGVARILLYERRNLVCS